MASRNLRGLLLATCAFVVSVASGGNALAQSSSHAIETVVVTARYQATQMKKNAVNVIDVQPLEVIRALPDITAAEALQRIPGISMESDSGEGRFINIRGEDADLNGTTYDGVHLTPSNPASPQGGARAVAFDAFPSGVLGGLEVFKSMTPEMDAEGLGGVINIVPRKVSADQHWLIDASIGSGLQPLRGTPVYQGDITAGTRFGLTDGDDRFSVIGTYGIYDDQRGVDDVEEDYANDPALPAKAFQDLQMRYYKYHRTRQGFSGGLTFDLDSDTSFYVRGLTSGYTELAFKHYLVLLNLNASVTGVSANGTIATNQAAASEQVTDTKETLGNELIEFGGHTVLGGIVQTDFRGSWTRGYDEFPRGFGFSFTNNGPISLVYNNTNADYPSFQTTDGTDLTNPNDYTNFGGTNGLSRNSDQEWAGKVDFSIPAVFDDNDGIIKFGGSVRERTTFATVSNAQVLSAAGSYALYSFGADRIYYNNTYNIGPSPNFSALAALPQGPQIVDPTAFQGNSENVYAGYGQYSATFGALDALAGVRVESTEATYRANQFDDNGNIVPSTANRSYTDVFPDLDLKYHVTDDFLVRGDYSTAIARPGFNQITAAVNVSIANNTVDKGNPNLKPETANAFDLAAEYYMDEGGLASVGLFWKLYDNYIVQTQQNGVTFPYAFAPGGFLLNAQVTDWIDIGSAHAEGIELNLIQKFTFLPDPFDGLGFEGNATFVGSSGQIRPGEKHTLPQTSPINYNAALTYDKGPFTLRFAASYVSRNLWAVGSDDSTDLYSQPRFRLDLGATYRISDDLVYYVDVKNISNTYLEFTQTPNRNFPTQREFYGQTYLTGLRLSLGG